MADRVSFALALGGGGARGLAHVHVMRAFDDLGIVPAEISGSSIGALLGAAYASGMSGEEIGDFFIETFANRGAVIGKLWRQRPQALSGFFGSSSFGRMDLQATLEAFLPDRYPRRFEDLKIPLKVTGTDYYGNALKVMESGDVRKVVAASAALPVIFEPIVVDGVMLIDGGINNPVPFDLLDGRKHRIVAVDVVGLPSGDPGSMPSRIDSAFGASQLMMQAITGLKLKTMPPDLFLRPPVDTIGVLDFLKSKKILEATKPVYDETRRGLERLANTLQVSA